MITIYYSDNEHEIELLVFPSQSYFWENGHPKQ